MPWPRPVRALPRCPTVLEDPHSLPGTDDIVLARARDAHRSMHRDGAPPPGRSSGSSDALRRALLPSPPPPPPRPSRSIGTGLARGGAETGPRLEIVPCYVGEFPKLAPVSGASSLLRQEELN